MHWASSTTLQAGILLTTAAVCALVSNALADPSRRLDWRDQPAEALSIPPTAVIPAPTDSLPIPPSIKPISIVKPIDPANPDRFTADPAQPVREISQGDAWTLYRTKAPFLDARRSNEYTEGHIAGAWNVSVWESTVEAQITEFEAAAKPGSTIPMVLYCSGGDCEDSHLLASRLTALGYRNLLVYRAGYPDWVKHGRPIEKGGRP